MKERYKKVICTVKRILAVLKASISSCLYMIQHTLDQSVFDMTLVFVTRIITVFSSCYPENISMNRTVEESVKLLNSLVDSYIKTHSDTTLEQISQVLKNEFVKRGR